MDNDGALKLQLEYAWNWFHYHAEQRLRAFHFFLIIIGLFVVAYGQAITEHWEPVGAVIGILGTLVAMGFLALDVRNEELVTCGLQVLIDIEDTLRMRVATSGEERECLEQALGDGWVGKCVSTRIISKNMFKHRTWLRLIELLVGLMFLVASIWALSGFPGA